MRPRASALGLNSAPSTALWMTTIFSAFALPVAAWAFGYPPEVIAFTAVSAVAIVWLHRGNLRRLRAGTENRFHRRSPAAQS